MLSSDDFVFLYDCAKTWMVRCSDIIFFEADGNDTIIHLIQGKISVRKTISKCEEVLDPSMFFRANRSCIVNLSFVAKVEILDAKRYEFRLKNDAQIILSRNASLKLRREKRL